MRFLTSFILIMSITSNSFAFVHKTDSSEKTFVKNLAKSSQQTLRFQSSLSKKGTRYVSLEGNKSTVSEGDILVLSSSALNLTSSTYTGLAGGNAVTLEKESGTQLSFMVSNIGTNGSKTLSVVINSITYTYEFELVSRAITSTPSADIQAVEDALLEDYQDLEDLDHDQDDLDYIAGIYQEYQSFKALLTSTEEAEMISIYQENFGDILKNDRAFQKLSTTMAAKNTTLEFDAQQLYDVLQPCNFLFASLIGTALIGASAYKKKNTNKFKAVGTLALVGIIVASRLCNLGFSTYLSQIKFLDTINPKSTVIQFDSPPWGTLTDIEATYRTVNSGDIANINSLEEKPKKIVDMLLGIKKVYTENPSPGTFFDLATYSGSTSIILLPGHWVTNVTATNSVTIGTYYGEIATFLYASAANSRSFDFTVYYSFPGWVSSKSQTFGGYVTVSK